MTRTAFLALLVVAALPAQESLAPVPTPSTRFAGTFVADPDADGAIWARGGRYKLGLTAAGAAFVPLFGPKAPRDFPVRLRLAGARIGAASLPLADGKPWRRDGERLLRDHGGLRECWRVQPDAAQQYFEIDRPAAAGGLALRIAVDGELAMVDDGPGVRFPAPGLGEVRYSDAIVLDARGRRLDVPVQAEDGALAIAVPAAFLADAAWPIVVDPLLTTVSIDTSISDIQDPRVTCEPTTGNWLVVAEEHLSATSVDIVCFRYSSATPPVLLDTVYAENGADRANNPGVGFVAQTQQFAIAWHNATVGGFEWRARSATSAAMTATLQFTTGAGGDLDNRPLIGSTLNGDRFLTVVFRKNTSGTDMLASIWRSNGANFGSMFVGPVIAPVQGTVAPGGVSVAQSLADKWVVVWRECTTAACAGQVVRMQAIVSNNGVGPLVGEPTVTLETASLVTDPDVAGHGGRLLAVWRVFDGTTVSNDIHGVPIGITAGLYAPQGAVRNLSVLEPTVRIQREQFAPSVSYDGCRFVYGYLEDNGNDLVAPHAATVFVDGANMVWHEGHLPLATVAGLNCRSLDLGYGANGSFGVHWAVWQQDSPAFTGDVRGAVIDARQAGSTSTVTQTGCGLPVEPGIGLAGTPALGRSFTVTVTPPAGFPFLLAGAASTSTLPGCGSCLLGVERTTMIAFVQPALSVSVPCDVAMVGLQLAFQGLVAFQTGGCPPPVAGLDFALSDTIAIQVR